MVFMFVEQLLDKGNLPMENPQGSCLEEAIKVKGNRSTIAGALAGDPSFRSLGFFQLYKTCPPRPVSRFKRLYLPGTPEFDPKHDTTSEIASSSISR